MNPLPTELQVNWGTLRSWAPPDFPYIHAFFRKMFYMVLWGILGGKQMGGVLDGAL